MAEELITYGMVRDKGYNIPLTKRDNEYAIKADFESGGAVGVIPMTNLSGYESMELIPDSAIPIRKTFIIRSNESGTVYLTNYSITFNTNLDSLISRLVNIGDNTITLPVTVSGSSGNVSLDVGSRIYIYEKLKLGNKLLADYNIVNGGSVTVTFSGGGTTPPDPTNKMTLYVSGVGFGYDYTFSTGPISELASVGLIMLTNGNNVFNIPLTVYNPSLGKQINMSSGSVGVYKRVARPGRPWSIVSTFDIIDGSTVSINVS